MTIHTTLGRYPCKRNPILPIPPIVFMPTSSHNSWSSSSASNATTAASSSPLLSTTFLLLWHLIVSLMPLHICSKREGSTPYLHQEWCSPCSPYPRQPVCSVLGGGSTYCHLHSESTTLFLHHLPHSILFHLLGRHPTYDHMRVFGCLCFSNTLATSPHRVSPHSSRCVFIG